MGININDLDNNFNPRGASLLSGNETVLDNLRELSPEELKTSGGGKGGSTVVTGGGFGFGSPTVVTGGGKKDNSTVVTGGGGFGFGSPTVVTGGGKKGGSTVVTGGGGFGGFPVFGGFGGGGFGY